MTVKKIKKNWLLYATLLVGGYFLYKKYKEQQEQKLLTGY